MTALWFKEALLATGWAQGVRLTLARGRIERVETGAVPGAGDERHDVAIPGLPNLHSHAFQRAMAGLTERRDQSQDNFWTWRELMYRFVDRLQPDDVAAIAAQAFMEMLECGFTHVGEFHYLHNNPAGQPYAAVAEMATRVAEAAKKTGIRLTLLPVFYAHSAFGGKPPTPNQRRFMTSLDSFATLMEESRRAVAPLGDAVVGIAPHSLRATTREELTALVPLAKGNPIHIHIAEQTKEVEDCLAATGARPVQWLLEHMPVNEHWCLVHATHTTPEELRGIAARNAVVGLCPITEANLGDGVFDAGGFTEKGGRFGVGSDSNVLIDAPEELRLLEYGQRLIRRQRNVLSRGSGVSTGQAIFDHALSGGAAALSTDPAGLIAGAAADIVTFGSATLRATGLTHDRMLDYWIFAARGQMIDTVWRAGRKVVEAGRHCDRDAIETRYARVMKKLLAT